MMLAGKFWLEWKACGKKNVIGCKNGPGMNALYTHQFGGLTAIEGMGINRLGFALAINEESSLEGKAQLQ